MEEYIHKQRLLEKARYHQNNIFGAPLIVAEIEKAETTVINHGKWVVNSKSRDGYKHHMCSVCRTDAIFEYLYDADYDEMLDGEWEYIGQRDVGIKERLSKYCPECGSRLINHDKC